MDLAAYRTASGDVHGRAGRGVPRALRGSQSGVRRRADLRAPRRSVHRRDGRAAARAGGRGGSPRRGRGAPRAHAARLRRRGPPRPRLDRPGGRAGAARGRPRALGRATAPARRSRSARRRSCRRTSPTARAARRSRRRGWRRPRRTSTRSTARCSSARARPRVELGWPSYRALCEELKGFDLDRLARATEAFTRGDRGRVRAARRAGRRAHARRPRRSTTSRAPTCRGCSASPRPTRRSTARSCCRASRRRSPGSGSTRRRSATSTSTSSRVPASRRAPSASRCSVPQDVRLVVPPIGGRDDFTALLHEGGHVEHYAHVDPTLAFEYRHLGDNAITEAFAFLFDHLVEDPEWLRARLGVQDADGTLAAHARATRLIYLRRYAAKLPYELDVHAPTRRPTTRCASATRRCSAPRRACAGRARPTSPTSTPASTSPATCARGRSRRTCARTCASASASAGSSGARPATRCARCGATASGCPPRSCSAS